MSPKKWDKLPWWEKRFLLEGLEEDGTIRRADGRQPPVASRSGNGTVAAMTKRNVAVDLSKLTRQMAELQAKSVLDGL